jgi:hypothetical protein
MGRSRDDDRTDDLDGHDSTADYVPPRPPPPPAPPPLPDFGAVLDPVIRKRRVERRGRMTPERLLVWTLLAIIFLGAPGWLAYHFVYVPKILKPRQYQQRLMYERWEAARDEYLAAQSGDDPDRPDVKKKNMEELERECVRRFGDVPFAYRGLPPSLHPYYDDQP